MILEAVVNMVHLAAAHQVVPPADLAPVILVPDNGPGLGHALVIADEKVKFLKDAFKVIGICQI